MKTEESESLCFGRRTFLKTAMAGIAALSIPFLGVNKSVRAQIPESDRLGFLYDSSACIGCNLCHFSCKIKHGFPKGQVESELSAVNWLVVERPETDRSADGVPYVRQSCMHCEDAMCQVVCPVEAVQKWNGLVFIEPERCIGCGYCVQACPYGRPHKNEGPSIGMAPHGVSRKCDGCVSRVQEGIPPACANACPAGALQFGLHDEMVKVAETKVAQNPDLWVYGLRELGGLGVLYLLPKMFDPSQTGLFPEVPSGYASAVNKGLPLLGAAAIGGLATFGAIRMKQSAAENTTAEASEDATIETEGE